VYQRRGWWRILRGLIFWGAPTLVLVKRPLVAWRLHCRTVMADVWLYSTQSTEGLYGVRSWIPRWRCVDRRSYCSKTDLRRVDGTAIRRRALGQNVRESVRRRHVRAGVPRRVIRGPAEVCHAHACL
jgi:hypothetical protein